MVPAVPTAVLLDDDDFIFTVMMILFAHASTFLGCLPRQKDALQEQLIDIDRKIEIIRLDMT